MGHMVLNKEYIEPQLEIIELKTNACLPGANAQSLLREGPPRRAGVTARLGRATGVTARGKLTWLVQPSSHTRTRPGVYAANP